MFHTVRRVSKRRSTRCPGSVPPRLNTLARTLTISVVARSAATRKWRGIGASLVVLALAVGAPATLAAQPPSLRDRLCRAPLEVPAPPVPRRPRGTVAVVWHSLIDRDVRDQPLDLGAEDELRRAGDRFARALELRPVARCYDEALRRDAATRGAIRIHVSQREGRSEVEVEDVEVSDPALVECVRGAVSRLRFGRMPASPMRFQLGFCPRHEAACFVGSFPRLDGAAARPLAAPIPELLERARPELQACVADVLRGHRGVQVPVSLSFGVEEGVILGTGTMRYSFAEIDEALRQRLVRCAAEAVARQCVAGAPSEVPPSAQGRVLLLAQTPQR